MPYAMIFRYTLSALLFALAACGLWLAGRLILVRRRWERRDALAVVTVGYLAAVIQIIGLRIGLVTPAPMAVAPSLAPLSTTIGQWRKGPGRFIYHTVGNLIWFVPLGLLLPSLWKRCRWHHALLAGALLSLGVEAAQYLLGTGISDIDDVLLNTLGALAGYAIYRLGRRLAVRREGK